MTSINSLTGSSSTSSIYGSRNVISGLASGLDTETLIENAVKGYQNKITSLKQQQEMIQWKQDAYRSIIDKMVQLNRSYTSYTSSTNLMSPTFFNKAVTTKAIGEFADLVSASGKTSSNVQLNGVKQLAKAASYRMGVGNTALADLSGVLSADGKQVTTTAADKFDLKSQVKVSDVTGGMTLKYGGSSVYLKFDEMDAYENGEELAAGIREKLDDALVKTGSGDYVKASDRIDVKFENGKITFSDKSAGKNSVYVASADDSIKAAFGVTPGTDAKSINVPSKLSHEETAASYLGDKTINVNLNGTSKTINLKDVFEGMTDAQDNNQFVEQLNKQLNNKFGKDKVTASLSDDGRLSFTTEKGATLAVTSDAGEAMGLSEDGLTSYLNTSTKLGDLGFTFPEDTPKLDKNGNPVKDSEGNVQMVSGKLKLTVNGKEFEFDKDTTLNTMMNAINSDKDAGVNISYSKLTNEFLVSAKETGAASKVEMSGDLASVFGFGKDGTEPKDVIKVDGQDAIFTATINGQEMEMTRASNTVDFDGLSVTFQDTFGYEGDKLIEGTKPVTFETTADADTIIDAIESFVNDYNAMAEEIRNQYGTLPNYSDSKSTRYQPLTDEEKQSMSESAIAAYEEKAKQGILFGDSELSMVHDKLRSAISLTGEDAAILKKIGISTTYDNYTTKLSLDKDALREALKTDPDSVRDIFSKSQENGATSDGLVSRVKQVLDTYTSTSTGNLGILVQKSGSVYAPSSLNSNTFQTQYDALTTQIEKWQDKMSDQVDYYTSQFTALEQLMSQMNNQSSMLASMMNGGGSY